ncbi:hypothetical protein CLOM_g12578, partial [Closterium sp. NIES-68]
RVVSRP